MIDTTGFTRETYVTGIQQLQTELRNLDERAVQEEQERRARIAAEIGETKQQIGTLESFLALSDEELNNVPPAIAYKTLLGALVSTLTQQVDLAHLNSPEQ